MKKLPLFLILALFAVAVYAATPMIVPDTHAVAMSGEHASQNAADSPGVYVDYRSLAASTDKTAYTYQYRSPAWDSYSLVSAAELINRGTAKPCESCHDGTGKYEPG